jgi:GTP-dependent phosphoenolpyruvate carboxykinase
MAVAKYMDKNHEYLRAKCRFYYKPNLKSLKYFAKKLKLSHDDLEKRFGNNVFTDDNITQCARDVLKLEVDKDKVKKTLETQEKNYKKYIDKIAEKIEQIDNAPE